MNNKRLHCLKDYTELSFIEEKKMVIQNDGSKFILPIYKCLVCGELYSSVDGYKDKLRFRFKDTRYINILPSADRSRYNEYIKRDPMILSINNKYYVYGSQKVSECRLCQGKLEKRHFYYLSKKRKNIKEYVKYCVKCDCIYLNYYQYEKRKTLPILNRNELSTIEDEIKIKREIKAKRKAEMQATKEQEKKKRELEERKLVWSEQQKQLEEEKRSLEEKRKLKEIKNNNQEAYRKKIIKEEKEQVWQRRKQLWEEQQNALQIKKGNPTLSLKQTNNISKKQDDRDNTKKQNVHVNAIGVKDFVVRRSTFKCRHNNHQLQNIDAKVNVIDKKGEIRESKVAAGYCATCNTYFIMESVFQNLKNKGTPVCRMSDEKAYLNNHTYVNGMILAQESILKQYGYTVSQNEGLSDTARRKILALLIDHKILTKNDVISYLDFFINNKKYQHKYEKALDKWQRDKEFVSEYKIGQYIQYGVGSINRKY